MQTSYYYYRLQITLDVDVMLALYYCPSSCRAYRAVFDGDGGLAETEVCEISFRVQHEVQQQQQGH